MISGSEIAGEPILIEQSDESQTAQTGLVHRFDMTIEKPPVGTIGMTAVDLMILVDAEDMELSCGHSQTSPTGGIGQVEMIGGLFDPIALEKLLKRPGPQGFRGIDPDAEGLEPIRPRTRWMGRTKE